MFQSDDQQLFIGKIPPEVQESDLRVRTHFSMNIKLLILIFFLF